MYRPVSRLFLLATVAGLMAGCSSMPEWTKPSSWYDGVTAPTTEKAEAAKPAEAAAKTDVAQQSPTALPAVDDPLAPAVVGPRIKPTDKPTEFPELAAQPAPREPTSTDSQKREIRDSLVADRDRAQYSADELRGGSQAAAAPPAPAAAKPAVEKAEEKPKDE